MIGAPTAVVVLAAGAGTRMKSKKPKVLHSIGGRSLLGHVLAAASPLQARHTIVVVGAGRDLVTEHLAQISPSSEPVVQDEQNGSGHAARLALAAITDPTGTIVVLNGDVPLLGPDTLAALCRAHEDAGNAMTILSAAVPDPRGLGRIVRDGDRVSAVVEHKDATAEQLAITEINAGAYAFEGSILGEVLARLSTDNAQGEEYLTEAVTLLLEKDQRVGAYVAPDFEETLGCNDRVELAERGRQLNARTVTKWMREGVTVVDPWTTWIDVDVQLAPDVTLQPNVQLLGATAVDTGAQIGPDCTLIDTEVGADAVIIRTHANLAVVGPEVSVGPFAYLRPKAILRKGAKAGTFVEMKNADIGEGAKVPHLTYVGDATVGEGTNIGASSVFVNYDGVNKHHTVVGAHCRMGSDNMYVAPVEIGDGSASGAGAVIRRNVPPGALAVSGGPQRNIPDWVVKNRAGTPSAQAALAAGAGTDSTDQDDDSTPTEQPSTRDGN